MRLDSVLISDAVDPACVQLLRDNGISVTHKTKMPLEELLREVQKHDGLIVRSDTKVTRQVLDSGSRLKVIGRAGTGVDNIDLEAATANGVVVMNTPGGNSISACELTCALISSLARHVSPASAALKKGSWERKNFAGTELYGKTLAVLGLGRIGREVATRMQAFGMKTIGFDPVISAEAARDFDVEKMELEQIWPLADYITVHTPLIPQTRNLINFEVLQKCKKGVYVVNVARGGIVDEEGLLRSLEAGQCGGAALDVFTEEPPKSEKLLKLLAHPRVLATPHLGASTSEAQQRVAVEIAEQFVALTKGEALFGVVNCPALATAVQAANKPWVDLARALGALGPSSNSAVLLRTFGSDLQRISPHLRPAVLTGMLGGGANLVNAPALAQAAGVTISSEHVADHQGHGVTLSFDQGRVVSGTLVDGVPSLQGVDGASFGPRGVELSGHLLLLEGDLSQAVQAVCAQGGRVVRAAVAGGCLAVHTEARVDAAKVPGNIIAQADL